MKNIKSDQSGVAHIGIILLIVAVIGAVGFVGWRVWDNQKQDKEASQSSTTSTTNNSVNVQDKSSTGIEIAALGIKVNDPEGRKLQLHTEKICAAECSDEDSYFIRDNNSSYFERCDYPTGVIELEQSYVAENPNASLVKHSRKIGNDYIATTLGSNFQSPCGDANDESYVTELRQYVLDNIEIL